MSNEKEKTELTVEYEVEGQKIKLTPSIVQQYIVGTNAKITLHMRNLFS